MLNGGKSEIPVAYRGSAFKKILLVEDNHDNRLTFSAILEEVEGELYNAEDGEEGVRLARTIIPDLIMMDIQLPVMSGLEAIRLIKSDNLTQHIPIIAVTARAMKGEKETILAAGADDYISKPVDPATLLVKTRKWMSQHEQGRNN